jgi:inner membrane protein involved in colicin E2 resistance
VHALNEYDPVQSHWFLHSARVSESDLQLISLIVRLSFLCELLKEDQVHPVQQKSSGQNILSLSPEVT